MKPVWTEGSTGLDVREVVETRFGVADVKAPTSKLQQLHEGSFMTKARQRILAAWASVLIGTATPVLSQTATTKLARGAAGITTGFLEIPGNIVQQTREKGAVGVPIGLALGLGMFVTRELVGAYELLTSPFPIPAGYKPILSPEYPWSYFAVTKER